jgi:hypothetical protein
VHADFAGPVQGQYLLVVIDAFSKWPEVAVMQRITTKATQRVFEDLFARFGNPHVLVTDNGTQFTAEEFRIFCRTRGIRQKFAPPYHPQSNGQAERFVDTVKRALAKMDGVETNAALAKFLQCYRNSPNPATPGQKTPAELFVGRKTRTALDLLKPIQKPHGDGGGEYREKMKRNFDRHHGVKQRQFNPKDPVFAIVVKNMKRFWVPGTIVRRCGTVLYEVEVDGRRMERHTNQLKPRWPQAPRQPGWDEIGLQMALTLPLAGPLENGGSEEQPSAVPESGADSESEQFYSSEGTESDEEHSSPSEERRYPSRSRQPPQKLRVDLSAKTRYAETR